MSAHIFDTPSSHCPICQRAGARPHKLISGFLTCQQCRERLVVSWSGHYVRDPFTTQGAEEMLRRESRPIARIRRDLKFLNPLVLGTLGGAVVFGLAAILTQPALRQYLPFQPAPPMQVEKPTPPAPPAS